MNYSDNYNFYLPSRDGEDAADINLISQNFRVIDEKLKENEKHQIETQIIDNNAFNVVSLVEKTNKIVQGITYNWDGGKYHISGTARAYSFYNIIYFADTIPNYIKLGHTYRVKCSIPASVQFIIMFFRDNVTTDPEIVTYYFNTDTTITIPEDITGICIRLGVSAGATVNNDIELSLFNAPTNQELEQEIKALKSGAVLTFIDDDGILEGLNNWQDVADRTGIKITFALITGNVGGNRYATWADVERMRNSGHDFISHTHGHINLKQTAVEAIESDFIASQNALKEHGCNPEHFAYPFGYVPTEADKLALIKHYFKSGIAIEYQENVPPLNTYKIMRESMVDTTRKVEHTVNGEVKEFYPVHSLDWFKDVIDTAKANNSWLIIMTHFRVAIDADGTGRYYVDEATKDLMVEVCKYAVSNGVKIQTYSEAFEYFKNQLECGSVDDDSYYIVDCYGQIHEK